MLRVGRTLVSKISPEDIAILKPYSWHVFRGSSGIYARARVCGQHVQLARFLMCPTRRLVVDHINGDTLDNRRENLRICSSADNSRNSRPQKNTATGFKGVTERRGAAGIVYASRIRFNHRVYFLGAHATAEDAARAYDKAAIKYFGEFARLNFPVSA